MLKTIVTALAASLSLMLASLSRAAILYSTPGSTYSQNFDSLPTTPENTSLGSSPAGWTDDNPSPGAGNFSIVGWYLYYPADLSSGEGGFNGHQRMRIRRGNSTTGAFMSWGSTGSSDRSLGMLNSNTFGPEQASMGSPSFYGARFTNNTGTTLGEFTLSYTGEQWHEENTTAQSITFDYSLDAMSIQDGGCHLYGGAHARFYEPNVYNGDEYRIGRQRGC